MATQPNTPAAPASDLAPLIAQIQALQGAMKAMQSAPGFSVTTDFGAACNMVTAVCQVALSPQGQLILADWRKAGLAAETWISKAATAIKTWFAGLKG